MKSNKVFPGLATLLVLAGCGKPPEPNKPEPEAPQLTVVAVTCAAAALTAGQNTECTASARDQNGEPFAVTSFTWTSGDEAIARVDASGKVSTVAVSSGNVSIRARAADSTLQGETSLAVAPKAPTVHSAPVTSAETWKAQDNPHLVTGSVSVDASAALTLEPGAVIRFAPDAELKVARGGLKAAGTVQAPVLLQAEKGGKGAWKGVVLGAKDAASSLEFITLSGCGGTQGAGACLVIRDGAAPVLKDVMVKDSGSLGVLVATADSGFGAGSARLSVSGSTGAAARLDANQAGTLPTGGTFTGNTPNVVELTGATVTRTQTWPNPGVPYVIKQSLTVGHPTLPATLSLVAGTKVRFGASTQLVVGSTGNIVGGLVLDGTAEAPILLTADSDNPQPGHWRGVHVQTASSAAGHISHATIEFAGKTAPDDERTNPGNGNLNLYDNASSTKSTFVLTDVLVRKSGGPGFDLSYGGEFGTGSARLTARENATYPIVMVPSALLTLPRDFDFRDNGSNVLALSSSEAIVETQTWSNLGLPYLLTGTLYLGGKNSPTLTLAAGTEIRVGPNSALFVGYFNNEPGTLIAKGTASAPIQFIPDKSSVMPGYWSGLHFFKATGSKLDHVLVSHGGETNVDYPDVYGPGNVNIHQDLGKFVTNSTLKRGSVCAYSTDSGVQTDLTDPSLNNNLSDNDGVQCRK